MQGDSSGPEQLTLAEGKSQSGQQLMAQLEVGQDTSSHHRPPALPQATLAKQMQIVSPRKGSHACLQEPGFWSFWVIKAWKSGITDLSTLLMIEIIHSSHDEISQEWIAGPKDLYGTGSHSLTEWADVPVPNKEE